jgi:acyl-Coa thioesterase superfamily protein
VIRSDELDVPLPEDCEPAAQHPGTRDSFASGLSIRVARGKLWALGPSAIWARATRPIVDQEPNSAAMRAAIAADFTNGLSAVLPFNEWTFLNADLTVNLARLPIGEWVLVNAETWLGPDGCALASSRLADIHGYFGRASQSLLIERRPPGDVRDLR